MTIPEIPAGRFKATCLRLIDEVAKKRTPIVVTKRGKPLVKLVPVDEETPPLFGFLKGTVTIKGDIIAPIEDTWDANE